MAKKSLPLALVGAAALLASGCLNQRPAPSEPAVSEEELLAYCPQITLRDDMAYFNRYAGKSDGADIMYQANISAVTRTCHYDGDRLLMTIAAAGRLVPGPFFKAGTFTLPIRVIIKQNGKVIRSSLHQYPLVAKNKAEATQFIFSDNKINIPRPTAKNVQIFVGFDSAVTQKPKSRANDDVDVPAFE